MNSKLVALLALVIVGGVVAVATGFGPVPGNDTESGAEITDFPTATDSPAAAVGDGADAGADESNATTADEGPPFTFLIEQISECGTTCRDVTVTLTNEQSESATDVTVYTRIYVGNSTAEEDVAWEGTEQVGRMEPNGTHTATKRVELSYSEALAIQQNDGWITVQTTVQSAERTVTFEERRNVT